MSNHRDQFKSSYAAHSSRERDLARSRARRDAIEAAEELAAGEATPPDVATDDAVTVPPVDAERAGR